MNGRKRHDAELTHGMVGAGLLLAIWRIGRPCVVQRRSFDIGGEAPLKKDTPHVPHGWAAGVTRCF